MPQVRKATEYAVQISNCETIAQLKALWSEINANREAVGTMYSWLVDFKDSRKWILSDPDDKDFLNEGGKKWLKSSSHS